MKFNNIQSIYLKVDEEKHLRFAYKERKEF